jgi:hypothetical protein
VKRFWKIVLASTLVVAGGGEVLWTLYGVHKNCSMLTEIGLFLLFLVNGFLFTMRLVMPGIPDWFLEGKPKPEETAFGAYVRKNSRYRRGDDWKVLVGWILLVVIGSPVLSFLFHR